MADQVSNFDWLPQKAQAELRLQTELWTQLGEMCCARESQENFAKFIGLMQGILDVSDSGRRMAHEAGLNAGCAIIHRCMSDNWNKGAIAGMKWICAAHGVDVPAFVHEMAAEVEYRDAQLRAETEAGRLLTQPVASDSPIH